MPEKSENYIEKLNKINAVNHNLRQIVTCLSFVVILIVFWSLKLTGIGVAGEAFCGKAEHIHSEECGDSCPYDEHIHVESCYSNIYADIETSDDWETTLSDMVRGPTPKVNLVLVAQSQLGYTESDINFHVDDYGVRRGITRYGQWYGNPYGDWSAMFVSFCLHYAGANEVPMNAGPESMRLEWEEGGLYKNAAEITIPEAGDLVFLHRGDSDITGANSIAIITQVDEDSITVIEGDINGSVAEAYYDLNSTMIMGYGTVPPMSSLTVVDQSSVKAASYTIWLDGTDGGLGMLSGSPNTAYTAEEGSIIMLPESWTSPSKYSYTLRGWYDITNSRYYKPGAEMTVTGNAVLYADWVASTYDLGVFNAQTANTVSTDSFITTHMFDYNYLFNIQSSDAAVNVSSSSHSETWSMVTSGNVDHGGAQTFDYIFTDSDSEGKLNAPRNRSDRNLYHEPTTVTSDIYTSELGELLFGTDNSFDAETGTGVLGKTYLGTGDHLFQIMDDPDDEYYGYYYYDSKRNAASFNQTNKRFYVYDYLSATSDSIGGAYSDFLPLNSPYANTNGKTVGSYNYDGVDGEYSGIPHYRYDSKYNSGDYNSTNNVNTDYAYGMRSDINFYLTHDPGEGGNKDLYGNDIEFRFSGDDDLWVLIDGKVVLDIGGIHQSVEGIINFTTGQITVNGNAQPSLSQLGIEAGDHVLSVLYLERGASMSNCSIYFNLVPRFSLELMKEDVLSQTLLDGAKFTVYEDFECTKPAELWESEKAYNEDLADGVLDSYRSTFVVTDGIAKLWGLGSGNTYYIKETGPPTNNAYGRAEGVIRITLEKSTHGTYSADIISDAEGHEPSNGFTVHGVNIDEKTKGVFITVTNAPETVVETTTVQIIKKWEDTKDHSDDYIVAYLTVTDPDGTVRRIREVTLSSENDWMYVWTNLPKYNYDTMTEVQYGVEESYESGYYSTVRKVTEIEINKTVWAESLSFKNGETYILRTSNGYLSTLNNNADTGYKWVDEETAKSSPNALWTASVSGSTVKFTNGIGQTITFYYNGGNPTDFFATSDSPNQQSRQEFSYSNVSGGLQIFYRQNNTNYYLTGSMNSSSKFGYSTNSRNALVITPICQITQSSIVDVTDWAYQITNTPLEKSNETSLTVRKDWVIPEGYDETLYHEFAVTVRLYANGVNTGRSVTLTLKNGWTGSFLGLPYNDADGNIINYTVVESWDKEKWSTVYGEIKTSSGNPATYSTVITNTYHPGGPELPSTGSAARITFVTCGMSIMLGTLAYAIVLRRKRERRSE